MEKFTKTNAEKYIRTSSDAQVAQLGHLNAIISEVNTLSAGGGGAGIVDTTANALYTLAVNAQLVPDTKYRITDYRSVNFINGFWNALSNYAPSYLISLEPYTPVNTNLGTGANDSVTAIAKDTVSGGVYVGGEFLAIDGNSPGYFQKLNADGTPNAAFNNNYYNGLSLSPGFDGAVLAIAVQNDGKVLVGGAFTDLNGTTRNRLVRFNADGTLDTAFCTNLGTAFDSNIYKIAIQPDGKILVGGNFGTFNGNVRNGLVRLNADGTEDATFATNIGAAAGVAGVVYNIIVSQFTPGKIYLVGGFSNWNGNVNTLNAVKLNANGTYDNTFVSGAPVGQKGYQFIYELSNGDLLMADGGGGQWNLTPLTSNIFRISPTGSSVNLGWGNVTGIVSGAPRVQVAKLSTGELVVASGKTADFDGVDVIAVYSEAGVRNVVYDPQGSFDQEVIALEVMLNGDYLLCGTAASGIYRGNAAPESLIALDLSTDSPYNARQIHTGDPEVIVVEAISSNRFAPEGYSETYGDIVEFNPICNTIAFPEQNGLTNGNTLPDSSIISGFDLQWDGQNAYFMMPTGYPILFGHFLYIYWDHNGPAPTYYQYFTEPILPGLNNNSNIQQFTTSIPTLTVIVSNDGMKVTMPGVTYQQFLDYNLDSLYLDVCIESQGPAYGQMNRRTNPVLDASAPIDWRNFRYRAFEFNIPGHGNQYMLSFGSGSDGGDTSPDFSTGSVVTTGNYEDVAPFGTQVLSVHIAGRGSTTAYWYYNGSAEFFRISNGYNSRLTIDYFNAAWINDMYQVNLNMSGLTSFVVASTINNSNITGSFGSVLLNNVSDILGYINIYSSLFSNLSNVFFQVPSSLPGGNYTGAAILPASNSKQMFIGSDNTVYCSYYNGTAVQYATSPF
jgi:uncharacterized delta-60 repeat protein